MAVALPILNWEGTIQSAVRAVERWAFLRTAYQRLWDSVPARSDGDVLAEFDEIERRELELSSVEAMLPRDATLLEQCYAEVLRSRGLRVDTERHG